ncbi:MAG: SUMF1/EgtB/PvdO family nonheme iron enzyme [Chlamydiia bacterium]|nr:SUMF1/EgtB/PvdO family nonheme iron enzyme [Chlamydiia bacterium]
MDKSTLGDYSIIKQIGQGTLGNVYLAEHRFVKQQYVLKVLPEELSTDRKFIQRFEKEVATLAKLDHPHIVKTHNISFAEGYYFLVNDCIVDCFGETTNLTQYLSVNKQSLNENEILELLKQVASALTYAHKIQLGGAPLAHRGIKLNNILIGKGERGLHVYLSDFGLSHIVGEGAVLTRMYKNLADVLSLDLSQSTFTKPGEDQYMTGAFDSGKLSKLHASFLQTYHFLAPEQKIYREKPVGPKADVYAFGILAYFLLMHSFPEGNFYLPCEIYPDFRLNWNDLIQECLRPDPNKRPDSFLKALEKLSKPQEKKGFPTSEEDILDWDDKGEIAQEIEEEGGIAVAIEKEEVTPEQTKLLHQVSEMVRGNAKPVLKPQEIKRPEYDPDPAAAFHVDSTVARYVPQEEEVKNIEPIQTDMVVIEGGDYYRGSDEGGRDERPRHQVKLLSFALDVHPVTNEQFARFLEVMGGEKDSNNNDIILLRESRIRRHGGKLSIESGYSKHPVIGVTWYGAIAYAKWVGKRLPTEAEWEIAASGGEEMMYPTGASIERTQANFFSSDTTAVKSYPPNTFGLYDMVGNVYEWCQDWYDYNYYEVAMQRPDNPKGPLQGVYRVLRGGCWKSLKDDLRCSHRHRNNPGIVNRTYGFRCAADVNE